jgi:CAAX prenyl protease-like protein
VARTAGYVVAVPLAEELAFRGFLRRWIVRHDFDRVPMGTFTWGSFIASSLLFGALHGSFWLAGTLAGMSFALAVYRRGTLVDAVQAHATTNGLLALYAFTTGQWHLWS